MKLELHQVRLPLAPFALEMNAVLNEARTAIFGPSGSGKTSLLEAIVGLRRPAEGRITFDGQLFDDASRRYALAIQARRVGYVPQDDSLFPHLSVKRNLLYGKNGNGQGQALSFEHVVEFLELKPLLDRSVGALSRGENQRIVIARALLSGPRLLLLDEPLTGLDARLKETILEQLSSLHREFQVPLLYVTHDPAEAIAICDEVLMVQAGKIVARGAPSNLLSRASALID